MCAQVITAALQHYTSGQDPARKNAAVFFGAALSYRTLLDAFDRAGGLRIVLCALQGSLLMLKGGPGMQELRMEKQARIPPSCMHLSSSVLAAFLLCFALFCFVLQARIIDAWRTG